MADLVGLITAAAAHQPVIGAVTNILDVAWRHYEGMRHNKEGIRELLERCDRLATHSARTIVDNRDASQGMKAIVDHLIRGLQDISNLMRKLHNKRFWWRARNSSKMARKIEWANTTISDLFRMFGRDALIELSAQQMQTRADIDRLSMEVASISSSMSSMSSSMSIMSANMSTFSLGLYPDPDPDPVDDYYPPSPPYNHSPPASPPGNHSPLPSSPPQFGSPPLRPVDDYGDWSPPPSWPQDDSDSPPPSPPQYSNRPFSPENDYEDWSPPSSP